jgi:hypothetical protein
MVPGQNAELWSSASPALIARALAMDTAARNLVARRRGSAGCAALFQLGDASVLALAAEHIAPGNQRKALCSHRI